VEEQLVLQVDANYEAKVVAKVMNMEWAKVWDQVRDQVGGQVGGQVRDQVWDQVRDQVWGQVWGQVWDQVGGQVRDQVRDKKIEYFSWCSYGDINDYGWCSFYDFFDRIGIVKLPNFNRFISLLDNNIFLSIQLKGLCIYSKNPDYIRRDAENNLHSEYSSALKWSSGYELFFLHGIGFTKEEHSKVTSRTMSFSEIQKIENADKKAVAMKFCKRSSFIQSVKAELLDGKTWKGNSLYKIPKESGVFDQDEYFLAYDCPSSGREYFEAVDPNLAKKLDYKADACLAARHHFTVEQYYSKAFVSA